MAVEKPKTPGTPPPPPAPPVDKSDPAPVVPVPTETPDPRVIYAATLGFPGSVPILLWPDGRVTWK